MENYLNISMSFRVLSDVISEDCDSDDGSAHLEVVLQFIFSR